MSPVDPVQQAKALQTILNSLINIPLFDKLEPGDLKVVAKQMNYARVATGQIVFREGDRGDSVCFVVDGSLDVVKESGTGDPVVIATLPSGRCIGEMALVDDFPRSATIRAKTDATLVSLSRETFENILQEHPQIGIKILKAVARLLSLHLRRTSGQLADHIKPGG
ncbi:MAG: cyclic nucleotide-binding domain-containing protein [Kiritimatiellae bacterium]|nr:cyclic nucleotide-binding domain-containing protein [Kiritimatiellia bacterium]